MSAVIVMMPMMVVLMIHEVCASGCAHGNDDDDDVGDNEIAPSPRGQVRRAPQESINSLFVLYVKMAISVQPWGGPGQK